MSDAALIRAIEALTDEMRRTRELREAERAEAEAIARAERMRAGGPHNSKAQREADAIEAVSLIRRLEQGGGSVAR